MFARLVTRLLALLSRRDGDDEPSHERDHEPDNSMMLRTGSSWHIVPSDPENSRY